MPQRDWLILMGMGGLFILLGLVAIIWGKSEEEDYYDSLSTRTDVREFFGAFPPASWARVIGDRWLDKHYGWLGFGSYGWCFLALGLKLS